ncbi:MAG: ATPase [Marinifilaceae bacterium]|jgi:N-acetylglucosamine kinase-like BadF-type ATPase|nr:ATPase [Marinifilaceae bacterium]
MKLICDSGSTKSEWVYIKDGEILQKVKLDGINPILHTAEKIDSIIKQLNYFETVENLFFYGAGCINDEVNRKLKEQLKLKFTKASIEVNSDLLGAARSLSQNEKSIVGILGTGSNSCFYDGSKIVENISPMGFIIGDEGSGAVMGKQLIADICKNQCPKDIISKFNQKYNLSKSDIVENIYRSNSPSKFLASFTYFLVENIENKYIQNLIYRCIKSFLIRNILQYSDAKNLKINFVGSIAYIFSDIIKQCMLEFDLNCGKIEKTPLNGLIHFHL